MPKVTRIQKVTGCVLGRKHIKVQGVKRHSLSLKITELQVVGWVAFTRGVYRGFLVPVSSSYLILPKFVSGIVD